MNALLRAAWHCSYCACHCAPSLQPGAPQGARLTPVPQSNDLAKPWGSGRHADYERKSLDLEEACGEPCLSKD